MELLIKVGNSYPKDHPCFDIGWKDGQIVDVRKDGFLKGRLMRKHFCVINIPFNLDDDFIRQLLFAKDNGKYPWESGHRWSTKPSRKRDWFIDYKRLLDDKLISTSIFESIYDKSKDHPKIYIDRDLTNYILHEDEAQRKVTDYTFRGGSISSGTYTVGSDSGDDYSTWSAAISDLVALTGNLTLKGARAEEISEISRSDITINTSGYTLKLTVDDDNMHDSSGYGNGHRIKFASYCYFRVIEDNDNYVNDIIIEKLAIKLTDAGAHGVNLWNGGDITPAIVQRLLIKDAHDGATAYHYGVFINEYYKNAIVRNNIILGNTYTAGINYDPNAGSGLEWHIYNNTMKGCKYGIRGPSSSQNSNVYIKNNLSLNSGDNDFSLDSYCTHSKNVSSDSSSPDGSDYQNWNNTDVFEDYDNDDLRLHDSDDTLRNGDDLSNIGDPEQFFIDIEGKTRTTWYIGASELFRYIPYALAWGQLIRQDEEPPDGYTLVWGQVKTYYETEEEETTSDDLTANNILTGSPVVGEPTIGQDHQLDANNIITEIPILDNATLGQIHSLQSSDIISGNPELGTPSLDENISELTANDIITGQPTLDTPTVGQIHNFNAEEIITGSASLESPTISQIHQLNASEIATGQPVLGNPTIGSINELTANGVTTDQPILGQPTITEVNTLNAEAISTGEPSLGTPSIGQVHVLASTEIVTGNPVLGSPYIPGEEEAATTSFSTERISSFETVYILGEFTHGEQITIDIYAISTGNKIIDGESCSEIGDTGIYSYLFEPTDNISEEYLWIMTNSLRDITGKIKVGGFIDDIRSNLNRLLGLNKENMFITDTEYDYNGNLVSAKIKLYETKSDAEADKDEFAVYEVMAEYDADGKMSSYLVTKQ